MKFHYFAPLALSALNCADAFSALSANLKKAREAIERKEPEMFDDVHLPKSLGFKSRIKNMFQFEENTNTDVVLAVLLPTLLPDVEIPSVLGALDTATLISG